MGIGYVDVKEYVLHETESNSHLLQTLIYVDTIVQCILVRSYVCKENSIFKNRATAVT